MGVVSCSLNNKGSNVMLTKFIILLFAQELFPSPMLPTCCTKKTVGDFSYTLTDRAGPFPEVCKEACAYKRDGEEGSLYCFAPGNLSVHCLQTPELAACAGLYVSTSIGQTVSGDVEFTCGTPPNPINSNFNVSANGGVCVTPPAGHTNCNRGVNVTAIQPYQCTLPRRLNGQTTFVTIKKFGQNSCRIYT